MAGEVDALILGLDGQRSRDALLQLQNIWANQEQRPRLISAYPGILFRFGLEGMMDRSGADLLCLNSADDLALYGRGRKALGLDSSNAVVTGLPILWRTKQRTEAPENPSIVFFEQPSIPVHPLQRRFLCEQIKELAAAWPDHPVIFKPRTSSIESTLHRRHGEMASVIDKMTRDQSNLRLSFKPATLLLRQCGCAITVSSTAAMESMAMGISTRIVGDLGVTETLGNHFFASSGAIASFAAIKANPFEVIHDPSGSNSKGLQRDGEDRFITALVDRLNRPATPLGHSSHGPLSWGSTAWQKAALQQRGPADAEQRWCPLQPAQTSPHPSHAAQPARQRGGLRLALQTAAGTMTLLLVSDGGLERSACVLMAEALEQQGQRCITAGPATPGTPAPGHPCTAAEIDPAATGGTPPVGPGLRHWPVPAGPETGSALRPDLSRPLQRTRTDASDAVQRSPRAFGGGCPDPRSQPAPGL